MQETTPPAPAGRAARRGLLAALAAAALLVGIVVGLLLRGGGPLPSTAQATDDGILRGPFALGGEFELTDHDGGRTRLSELGGDAVLLFFGYTFCPDICPTALADMRLVVRELGSRAERVRVVFISVDGERDTPQRLREYVTHFDPRFVGLTGSAGEIAAVARAYGVAYEIGPRGSDGSYEVGHSAFTYLADTGGTVHAMFPYGTAWQAIAAEVARVL